MSISILCSQSGALFSPVVHLAVATNKCKLFLNAQHPLAKKIYSKVIACLSLLIVDESPTCFQISCRPLLCIVLKLYLVVFGSNPKDKWKGFKAHRCTEALTHISPIGPRPYLIRLVFYLCVRICLVFWGLDMKPCDEKCDYMSHD